MQFTEFPKIPRLRREAIITEKIDGTNASIWIENRMAMNYATIDDPAMPWISKDEQGMVVAAGSRTKWITPGKNTDNHGFAAWVRDNITELVRGLGPGHHFGEWWGSGIQRGYDLPKGEKRFSLFNTHRWTEETKPACCHVVPVLGRGMFEDNTIHNALLDLLAGGSHASPGFMRPEGIVVYHVAAGQYFKQTIEKDEQPKGQNAN